jgi:hypothetical protein
VDEFDPHARCSRAVEDSTFVARIEVHAVLCEHQLQSWSVDTKRVRCEWLPLPFFLLLGWGPSRRTRSRLFLLESAMILSLFLLLLFGAATVS